VGLIFTIYFFVNIVIIYILLSHFKTPRGEGGMGFIFLPFLFFVLCVKLLLPFFTFARGRGCGFSHFKNCYFIYF
jgi:hypothetical protein